MDVLPTVLRAAGGEVPAKLPGRSLLDDSGGPAERQIYSETLYPRLHFGWSDLASLADGRFHYVHAPRPELYDWASDPAERRDLSSELSAPFRAMRVELAQMSRPFLQQGVSDPETVKKLASLGYISVTSAGARSNDLPPKLRPGSRGRRRVRRLAGAGRGRPGGGRLSRGAPADAQLPRRGRGLEAVPAPARRCREAGGRPASGLGGSGALAPARGGEREGTSDQ